MAAAKKKNRKQGIVSKVSNIALIALGFSKAITIWLSGFSVDDKIQQTLHAYTGYNTNDGTFKVSRLAAGWAPVGAAVSLGLVKSYLLRKFPVRR